MFRLIIIINRTDDIYLIDIYYKFYPLIVYGLLLSLNLKTSSVPLKFKLVLSLVAIPCKDSQN